MKSIKLNNYTLNIGSNKNENNDLLDKSEPSYTWFHMENLPSCHGIINCSIENLNKDLIYKCALNIKNNTKFKKIPRLNVIYCELKNIQKTDNLGEVKLLKNPKKICI